MQAIPDTPHLANSDPGFWHAMLEWLTKNPALTASFIAAAVALAVGLLTYRGVKLSNREATKRLRDQLSHDASQQARNREHSSHKAELDRQHESLEAQKERLTTLRREVYLVAVPELIRAQGFLARLPQLNLSDHAQLSAIEGLAAAVGKVAVVGSQPTALKARKLLSMYGEIFFVGLKHLKSIAPLKDKARLYQNLYDKSQVEIQRIIDQLTHLNETRLATAEATAALSRSFDTQQENAASSDEELQRINSDIHQFGLNYHKEFLQMLTNATQELDELLCLLRSELGLSADINEFLAQSADAQQRMRSALEGLGVGFENAEPQQQLTGSKNAETPVEPQRPDLQRGP
jgi:hypothetical protein